MSIYRRYDVRIGFVRTDLSYFTWIKSYFIYDRYANVYLNENFTEEKTVYTNELFTSMLNNKDKQSECIAHGNFNKEKLMILCKRKNVDVIVYNDVLFQYCQS